MTIGEQTVTGPRGGLPHGGQLVDRRLDAEEASALASSLRLPRSADRGRGGRPARAGHRRLQPAVGFMGAKEHESVTESMRSRRHPLVDPVCLGIPDGVRVDDGRLALRGEGASCWACSRSPRCSNATGPPRPSWCTAPPTPSTRGGPGAGRPQPGRGRPRPGRGRPAGRAGGRAGLTPAETRAAFASRGWSTVVGFQTRNPVHRAHEYLMKCALEMVDGLLRTRWSGRPRRATCPPRSACGPTRRCWATSRPSGSAVGPGRAHALRRAPRGRAACPGPQELRLHPLHRRPRPRRGGQLLRHLRGPGADRLAARRGPGHHPLRFDNAFYCRRCLAMATGKTCPHPDSDHVALSGTQVRTMLAAGQLPPPEFSRPRSPSC